MEALVLVSTSSTLGRCVARGRSVFLDGLSGGGDSTRRMCVRLMARSIEQGQIEYYDIREVRAVELAQRCMDDD